MSGSSLIEPKLTRLTEKVLEQAETSRLTGIFNARSSSWKFISGAWRFLTQHISWLPDIGMQSVKETKFTFIDNDDDQSQRSGRIIEDSKFLGDSYEQTVDYNAFSAALERNEEYRDRADFLLDELRNGQLQNVGELYDIYKELVLENTSIFVVNSDSVEEELQEPDLIQN